MKTFLNTLQGKVITGLTIIALVMGIALEGIQISTAYNQNIITRMDAQLKEQQWDVLDKPFETKEEATKHLCDNPVTRARFPLLKCDDQKP